MISAIDYFHSWQNLVIGYDPITESTNVTFDYKTELYKWFLGSNIPSLRLYDYKSNTEMIARIKTPIIFFIEEVYYFHANVEGLWY